MPRSVLRLTLALTLLAATASAAAAVPVSIPGQGAALRAFLEQVFPVWLGKIGCSFDPNDCNVKPVTKNGCSYDPNGQCIPKVAPPVDKIGCSYDPDGRCIPGH